MSQCVAKVYYKDIPRRTGRGATSFTREWTWRQCKNPQRPDGSIDGLCFTHANQKHRCGMLVRTIEE